MIDRWKQRARALKMDLYALYLAYRDPRVSWIARLWVLVVVGYAFSPIDLIPDPIPVVGYLDDLILIPVGIWIALRLIPAEVLAECREQARTALESGNTAKPVNWIAAGVIVAIWIVVVIGIGWVVSGAR
jgi:uncharacterized membrane protein YkvA (DUF1232 family)